MSASPNPRRVLVTGGTGYIGTALIPLLLRRGHTVRALVRPSSTHKLALGAEPIIGDPLNRDDVLRALADVDTVVHLVGVPKPSPAKARQFREIDLVSIQALTEAITASQRSVHLIYLSVAHPAPVMRAYVAVREEGERLVEATGVPATFVRPWYVLGPGHRWPYLLLPVYALLRCIPATRPGAERLGFVTLAQITRALAYAVEHPETRILDVPAIRAATLGDSLSSVAATSA